MNEGVPISEIHNKDEINRLKFYRRWFKEHPEDHTPGDPLPHLPVVYTQDGKVLSISEFIARRRRRLPPHG